MSTHSRKPSSRAVLPRRTTKGPLDGDDPLSPSSSSLANPGGVSPSSALSRTTSIASRDPKVTQPVASSVLAPPAAAERKDLSFMLDRAIYHPLSQLEIPAPFRRPFPVASTESTPVADTLKQLDILLGECNFLAAAFLAGSLLGSGTLDPYDRATIFRLLAIRYSCLELSGNVQLAAQEAKALEDLGSGFYYEGVPENEPTPEPDVEKPLPRHIMPFPLRLQAFRLQSIGFSDPRRGVSALYDLGLECRENIAATAQNSESDRRIWASRLEEVGIRVVNALVEMGDMECARRTLDTMKPSDGLGTATWHFRMAIICLKIGLVDRVRALLNDTQIPKSEQAILKSLLAIAEDNLDEAIHILSAEGSSEHEAMLALAKQNLAVALLYKGEIERASSIMNDLVNSEESFQTLTINLATLYDLKSDRSKEMKLSLATRLAAQDASLKQPRPFTNADFKL